MFRCFTGNWKPCLDSLTEATVTISPLYDAILLLLELLCVGVTTLSFYDYVWIMIFLLLWQGPQSKLIGLGEGQAGILYVNYEYCISDEIRSYGTPKDKWRKWSDLRSHQNQRAPQFLQFFHFWQTVDPSITIWLGKFIPSNKIFSMTQRFILFI